MFVSVLESLQKSQSLIDGPSDGQIVHGDLPQNSFIVNDEESTETVTIVFQVHSVVLWDLVSEVGQQRNLQGSQTSFFARQFGPSQVGEMGVDRASDNLGVQGSEFFNAIIEG